TIITETDRFVFISVGILRWDVVAPGMLPGCGGDRHGTFPVVGGSGSSFWNSWWPPLPGDHSRAFTNMSREQIRFICSRLICSWTSSGITIWRPVTVDHT